jgi:hypothetical protein
MDTDYAKLTRYILFLIDSKIKEHDGIVFKSLSKARQYANDCIKDKYADKVVIGVFSFDPNKEEMLISMVQTIGFRNDVKHSLQLDLFKQIH